MTPCRGLALLIVVGVLGILAVLAAAFVTMAQLERKASSQRLYATKARLLARSGIEDALARLSAGQDPSVSSSRYGGEDWDASGGALSGFEASQEVFKQGTPDVETCPVRHALRPSFFVGDGAEPPLPRYRPSDGRERGYSGGLSGDKAPLEHIYALKVEDESAKINMNGGFLDALDRNGDGIPDHRDPDVRVNPADPKDTGLGWNFQLARILDVLGAQAEVGVPGLGAITLRNRPPGGYRAIGELEAAVALETGLPRKDLSPWLTVSSWIDFRVVHPNGHEGQPSQVPLSEVKKARVALHLEAAGRSPVNLNAAPRAVLVALLEGLRASHWETGEGTPTTPFSLSPGIAYGVAGAMVARRDTDPFDTWEEFYCFLDGLVPTVISGMNTDVPGNLAGPDLIKAALDPNTKLSKQLPDEIMFRWFDKSDLIVWSTEGSLGPTGTFAVTAVGRLAGPDGRLLAEHHARGMVEAFSLLRQTSQEDFVSDRQDLQEYLSLASLSRTNGAAASWNTWGMGQGLAVTTTPCAPTALPGEAAIFDGSIALGTVEFRPETVPFPGTLMFLQHFDDSWDGDTPGDPRVAGDTDALLQTHLARSVWPDPALSPPLDEPGTLYPDGAHVQAGRSPGYQAQGNFPPSVTSGDTAGSNHGILSYWVKPMSAPVVGCARPDFACVYKQFYTQALLVGRSSLLGTFGFGLLMENAAESSDAHHERDMYFIQEDGAIRLPGLRWHLMTAMFDTDVAEIGDDVSCEIRGIQYTRRCTRYWESDRCAFDVLTGQDIARNRRDRLILGGPDKVSYFDMWPCSVLDEFILIDGTDDHLVAKQEVVQGLVSDRHADGRYCKEGGAFLSGLLEIPGKGRLLGARWTFHLPHVVRSELAMGSDGSVPEAGLPRPIEPALRDGPDGKPRAWLDVELLDASDTLGSPPVPPLVHGGVIGRIASAFRYRVGFKLDLEDPLNDPVLETPWFDDITFAYQEAGGPRVLAWTDP